MLSVLTMNNDGPRRIDLEDLMQGCKKIILQHGQRPYFLTITRKGNLILTRAEEAENPNAANDAPEKSIN